MKLIDSWNALQRRINGDQPRATIAGGSGRLRNSQIVAGEPAKSGRQCVYLPANTDYKKLAITLLEQLGYVVVTERPRTSGRPARSTQKAGGVGLPTGIVLLEHIRVLREAGDAKDDRAALRRILEASIGYALAEQGNPPGKIKAVIDRELPNLQRRLREARTPRRRK